MPDYSIIKALCDELEISIEELMDGEKSEEKSIRTYDEDQILDLLKKTHDLEKQKDVLAGGSGPVCSALVVYSDIIKKLEKKELKRVLYIATGALFNPTSVFQKENILGIAHAISLESI